MSKKWDFLKEVTDIDDRFIEEAAGEWIQPIRNVQQILVKIAACFAIIVSLLLSGVSFNPTARVIPLITFSEFFQGLHLSVL